MAHEPIFKEPSEVPLNEISSDVPDNSTISEELSYEDPNLKRADLFKSHMSRTQQNLKKQNTKAKFN